MRGFRLRPCLLAAALVVALGMPAQAELRISDLDVFLNDYEVTVNAVALGAVPPGFHESIQSGLPTHVHFTIELWQYNRLWRDRLIASKSLERQLTYNVVTKEYRVSSVQGETRPLYTTRELWDATRVLSEVRGLKLVPAASLDPVDVIYVRVRVDTALRGENTFLARLAGTAEQTVRQSEYRTIMRGQ